MYCFLNRGALKCRGIFGTNFLYCFKKIADHFVAINDQNKYDKLKKLVKYVKNVCMRNFSIN